MLHTDYFLSARHLVKYPNCNATAHLFGGQLLSWIDEGAAMFAGCKMKTDHLVTLKMGEIIFKVPVERGQIVSIWCKVVKEGRTSITINVVATKSSHSQHTEENVIDTDLVFVSVDQKGRPLPWTK